MSLFSAAWSRRVRNIELVETKKYLEDDAIATEKAAQLSREQSEEKKGEGSGDVVGAYA